MSSSKLKLSKAVTHRRKATMAVMLQSWAAWSVGARELRVAKEEKRAAGQRRSDLLRRAALRLHGDQLRRCLRSWLLVARAEEAQRFKREKEGALRELERARARVRA